MGNLFLTLIGLLSILAIANTTRPFENKVVFKITNKGDSGVLAVTENSTVIVRKWTDSAEEKWRAHLPLLSNSYEFRPTSNEKTDLDVDSSSLSILARTFENSDGGESMYWRPRHMSGNLYTVGENVFEIKNYKYEVCLQSQGMNKPVALAGCDNNLQQQWEFEPL